MPSFLRRCFGLATVLLLAACADDPLGPVVPDPQDADVVADAVPATPLDDQNDAGILHFLPPLMPQPGPMDFDRTLLSWVVVHVCAETTDACDPLDRLDADTPGKGRLRLSDSHYHGVWSTRGLHVGVYRLYVTVADLEIGSLVLAVDDRGRLWNTATGAGLGRAGRSLSIAFRIEADPAVRARVMTETGATAVEIAGQLNTEFGSDENEISVLLRGEGFDASATGEALSVTFPELTPEVAGTAMFDAGYEPVDVAESLYEWWKANSLIVIPLLEAFGLTPEDVADALVDVYDYYAEELADALAGAGWAVDKVVQGVTYVYDNPVEVMIALLEAGVWTNEQIVQALDQATDWTRETIASALRWTGISSEDATAALKYVYGLGAEGMLALLEASEWTDEQITSGLNSAYDLSAEGLAQILKAAGWTVEQVEAGLHWAGYTASQIGDALEDVFEDIGDAWCDNVGLFC